MSPAKETRPADIFLTRGSGLLSRAIRLFTRRIGESRTKVNHVGLVVEGGPLARAVVVEALSVVGRHRLWERYGDDHRTSVAIFRPVGLSSEQVGAIVAKANGYVGRTYGWWMLLAHLADWVLQGVYVFRRLVGSDRYPICSWVVAHSYKVVGILFDVEAYAADPDDIWDYVSTHPEKFEEVRPLTPLASDGSRARAAAGDSRRGR